MDDKHSYGGFHYKIVRDLSERISLKMKELYGPERIFSAAVKSGTMKSIEDWSRTYEADLKRESDRIEKEFALMWKEGNAKPEFNAAHFKRFQEKVRAYGNLENKLINRYFKAMGEAEQQREEEPEAPMREKPPEQVEVFS